MNHDKFKDLYKRNKQKCSYNGCSSDSVVTNEGAISFFGFPKDTERCSKWITNSGREEFRFLTPHELSKEKLCELHFHPSMFSNKFRTRLRKAAFPMNWKNSIPELIEIEDDDDDDEDEEVNEPGFGENIGSEIVNGTNVQEVSDDDDHGGTVQNALNGIVMNLLTPNKNSTFVGDSSTRNEVCRNTVQEHGPMEVGLDTNHCEPPVESQTSAVTSSTSIVVKENSRPSSLKTSENSRTSSVKTSESSRASNAQTCLKSNPPLPDKTKFHNLPSQTSQGEFYYQQCPSVEETNHSYPEPSEGQMPLFVQQNSVSMVEETANSVMSDPPAKKRRVEKEAELSAQMMDAMKYLKDITELLTTSEDEFELFGKSVAVQLKKMSLCTALTVQAKIQQVMSQYRIHDIRKQEQKGGCSNAKVNGIEGDKSEDEVEEQNIENQVVSPQLSLDCISETSDNEVEDK